MNSTSLVTVQQHIFEEQRRHFPQATGEFAWLLAGLTLATKMIADRVRRVGLLGLLGALEQVNVQGEVQQKLDVYANSALEHCLAKRGSVAVMASEENAEPMIV